MKLKLLNSFIAKYGFGVIRVPKTKNRLLINVFKRKDCGQKVLISYVTDPFINGIKYTHSIYLECYTAATIFDKLGYQIDIVNYFDEHIEVEFADYDVIYGQGWPFEKAFYAFNAEKIVKILYGTGTSLFYFYKMNGQLVHNFYKKSKLLLPESARMYFGFWPMQYTCSDAVIALGNHFCELTYLEVNPSLFTRYLNAFYLDVYDINIEEKDFARSKNHFLWFGSGGLLTKGLGILIEIFSKESEIVLHICGASKHELKFWQYYQTLIDENNNIIEHGFIDINSDAFKQLMHTCCFTLFPSSSEGGAVACLNVMANGGLIPIISKSTCLDVEEFGFVFDEIKEDAINEKIDEALSLSLKELTDKAKQTKNMIRKEYSFKEYESNLTKYITLIVEEAKNK